MASDLIKDTAPKPNTPTDEPAAEIAHQFDGIDNDLVHIEAFDKQAPGKADAAEAEQEDIDETSAGGLQYPPGVETSGGGSR